MSMEVKLTSLKSPARAPDPGSKLSCPCGMKKQGNTIMVQCGNTDCKIKWWHAVCGGFQKPKSTAITAVGPWTCPLCTVKKLSSTPYATVEAKKVMDDIKSVHTEIKRIQDEMTAQLGEIKHLKESLCKQQKEEKNVFYEELTKNLGDFKSEIKEQQKEIKSYAEVLSANTAKLENHQGAVASKVAKEVVQETRIASYDRSQRENNVIVFGMKDTKDENEDDDKKFVQELFEYVGHTEIDVKFQRLGRKSKDKTRPVKIIFEESENKHNFMSRLYKLKDAPEKLKKLSVQHDLSSSERDNLKSLLDKAKSLNKDPEKPKGFSYKVRGPPFAFVIKKVYDEKKTIEVVTEKAKNLD